MKRSLFLLGLPLHLLVLNTVAAYAINYFLGSGFYYWLIGFFVIMLFIAPLYRNYTFFSLSYMYLPPALIKLGIKMPLKDIDTIEHAISVNEEIQIACEDDWLIRSAIAHYVRDRLGQVKFFDSGDWDLITQPLTQSTMLVTANSVKRLSESVGTLLSRGWKRKGSLVQNNQGKNSYAQEMIYVRG